MDTSEIKLGWQVVARLERLSVDSYWAHRASGVRRSLIRCLDEVEAHPEDESLSQRCTGIIRQGFFILENAAREMGDRK